MVILSPKTSSVIVKHIMILKITLELGIPSLFKSYLLGTYSELGNRQLRDGLSYVKSKGKVHSSGKSSWEFHIPGWAKTLDSAHLQKIPKGARGLAGWELGDRGYCCSSPLALTVKATVLSASSHWGKAQVWKWVEGRKVPTECMENPRRVKRCPLL